MRRWRAAALVLVAASATTAVTACSGDAGSGSSSHAITCGAPAADDPTGMPDGTVSCTGMRRNHVKTDVVYPQVPPVGGSHSPAVAACTFSDQPVVDEQAVHAMEHGAVWVTYSPDLPAGQQAVLRAMVDGHTHLLISPYPGLPSPVVASAWGEQLALPSATDPRLAAFVSFFESGPQTPEPGGSC